MAAISLAKLRIQIERLKSRFSAPHGFLSALVTMLELYADQTYHPRAEKKLYRLPYYQVPAIISRQLNREFQNLAGERPVESLENAHLLWTESHYETKVLAARLLGSIPAKFAENVINEIDEWQIAGLDSGLINELLEIASATVRRSKSDVLLRKIRGWVTDASERKIRLGLKALQVIAGEATFTDLPVLLAIFTPIIEKPTDLQVTESVKLYQLLVQRFPEEMELFSTKMVKNIRNANKQKLLRKAFSAFSPEKEKTLKSMLPPLKL